MQATPSSRSAGDLRLAGPAPARYVFGTKPDDDDHNVDGTAAYVEIDGSSWQYTGRVVDIRDGVLILHGRGRRCVNGELEYSDPHTFVWPTHRLRVARMPA